MGLRHATGGIKQNKYKTNMHGQEDSCLGLCLGSEQMTSTESYKHG